MTIEDFEKEFSTMLGNWDFRHKTSTTALATSCYNAKKVLQETKKSNSALLTILEEMVAELAEVNCHLHCVANRLKYSKAGAFDGSLVNSAANQVEAVSRMLNVISKIFRVPLQ